VAVGDKLAVRKYIEDVYRVKKKLDGMSRPFSSANSLGCPHGTSELGYPDDTVEDMRACFDKLTLSLKKCLFSVNSRRVKRAVQGCGKDIRRVYEEKRPGDLRNPSADDMRLWLKFLGDKSIERELWELQQAVVESWLDRRRKMMSR
ncbi:hypothetical protein ACTXJ8_13510, partial [Corynebacterium variabile]|uniref:hypothetical protein n=1 Tax=Corynebacterium variabile TaxID=1727 RepID=UPI003FD40C76